MDVAKLLKERETKFIETRTVIAGEVEKFLASLNAMDEDVRAQIVMPNGTTPQEILPALWVEPFNEEAYKQQLSLFMTSVQSAKACCDRLNQEAIKCLQQ